MQKILRRLWTTDRVTDVQASFKGGLNTTADVSQVAADQLRVAQNVRLTIYGAAAKRLGSQRVHATALGVPSACKGGFSWAQVSPINDLVVSNGRLYTGQVTIPMTWTLQTGSLSTTAFPQFTAFRDGSADVAYIADGNLNKWNGTTLTTAIAGAPAVTTIAVQNLRLFGAGDSANPQTLYFSPFANGDLLNNTTFQADGSAGGSAVIRTFGHQKITGLVAIGQSLLIFHERGISKFTGWSQSDFDINSGTRGISPDVGSIAPRSIVPVENICYFLTDRGIYGADESGVNQVSYPIESVLHDAGVANADFTQAWGVHNRPNREVWFYIPTQGVYVFNYRINAWSGPWDTVYATPITSAWVSGAASFPTVMLGGSDGFVRQADIDGQFQDDVHSDGTAGMQFTMKAQCHRFTFNDAVSEKAMRFLYGIVNTGGSSLCSLSWTSPFGGNQAFFPVGNNPKWGTPQWGSFTWDPGGSVSTRLQAAARGTYLDITFNDTSTNAAPVLARVEAEAFDLGRRQ
jgi:hypothetical protein